MSPRLPALGLVLVLSGCTPKSSTSTTAEAAGTTATGTPTADPLPIRFSEPPAAVSAPVGQLRRGINLGNGFDAPSIGAWGVVLEERHFEMAAQAGLDHVRLPVRFSAHALPAAPYAIDEEWFAKVDWAIDNALSRGLSIIVDLHHYEELMTEPDAHGDRLIALWDQIAKRYASQPPEVLFELVNEPSQQLTPDRYNGLLARLIPVIRRSNPERTLIVDSFFWAAPSHLKNLVLPDDPNLVVSFHMYQPILFTHQGASWMDPEFQTRGIIFPGPPDIPAQPTPAAAATSWTSQWINSYNTQPAERNPSSPEAVAREFDMATRYVNETGRRAYLGEFGAIDYADPTSRENYLRLVRREAERRGFAWAVWDDGGRNQAMNVKTGTWVEPVARALFTDQPGQPLPNLTRDEAQNGSLGAGGAQPLEDSP